MRHLGALAGVVVAAIACGTSSSAEDACGAYFDAIASLQDACATSLVDVGERAAFVKYCATLTTAPGTNDLVGALAGCTAAATSAQCTDANAVTTCNARGTLPDGAPCGSNVQCAGGQCIGTKQVDATSELECGVCATLAPVGSACGATTPCDPTTGRCVSDICVGPQGPGGDCHVDPDTACQAGLYCDFSSFTCMPPPALGAPCTGTCARPYLCFDGTCQTPVAQGGSCTSAPCAVGLTCLAGTCMINPVAQKGEPCTSAACATDLVCTAGTCQPPPGVGSPCIVGEKDCGRYMLCVGGACAEPDLAACK